MKIHLKTTMADATGAYSPGEVDLPAEQAKDLIAKGYAVPLPPKPERAVVSAPESRRHPLDHNGDGHPGGSKPFAERGLDELKAEAEQLGIKVNKNWGAARLSAAIAEARSAAS